MKATIDNIINKDSKAEEFEWNFDWMLIKFNTISSNSKYCYELHFCETTFYPEFVALVQGINEDDDKSKKFANLYHTIMSSPCYKSMIAEFRKATKAWFNSYGINGNTEVVFSKLSIDEIKNDPEFSKLKDIIDLDKMKIIDLT